MSVKQTAIRGTVARFKKNPFFAGPDYAFDIIEDAIIVVENGKIAALDTADKIVATSTLSADTVVERYNDAVIIPGFIDSHVHAAQIDIAAAYGAKLLDWLNKYTFPGEMRLKDADYGRIIADKFVGECARNGITCPVAFATSYESFTDTLFAAAEAKNLRIIAGSVFMNRNVPDGLAVDCQENYAASQRLIDKWHGRGRAQYSVIDRFAITSTHEEMEAVSSLYAVNKKRGVYFHTHLSENIDEVAFAKSLFPERASYLDIYDHYGLVDERSIFAHCIHLTEAEIKRLAEAKSILAHSPESNLFLGSGFMDVKGYVAKGLKVNLASDFGAGNRVSMLRAMDAAYKTALVHNFSLHPAYAYYLATAGAAENLGIGAETGNLQVGQDADIVVLDNKATEMVQWRTAQCENAVEQLFIHMILGDDRSIAATYNGGFKAYAK
ncbi:MAG: guanine deaminase [Bacillota bacterium]